MSRYVHQQPPLSMAVQVAGLRRLFPVGNIKWNRSKVLWIGKIMPGEFSRRYTAELKYEQGSQPRIWVREPDLKELARNRPLPHVYDQDKKELCLYVPGCGFWTPDKSLASTVMLWACVWLRHFEVWLVTDVFHGLGLHPEDLTVGKPK